MYGNRIYLEAVTLAACGGEFEVEPAVVGAELVDPSSNLSLRLSARSWTSSAMSKSSNSLNISHSSPLNRLNDPSEFGGTGYRSMVGRSSAPNDPSEFGALATVRWWGEAVQLS
jgi:hypothetical protein